MQSSPSAHEIRRKFLAFFEKRGHSVIPSASLVPQNDPSVLFNTAGMQPLVPYLLGMTHPSGTRLVNAQKCVRTQDIDEVGDNTHDTFFEMLGNWSLGDYFKKEAIEWSYDFLTSKSEGLGFDPRRLYVTCFEGNADAPQDKESWDIWHDLFKKNGVSGERIYFRPAEKNWWSVGANGPCGPDTEMFYDVTGTLTEGMTLDQYLQADDEQKVVEIWNDVFMEFLKKDGKVIGTLPKKNVDTGAGLERVVMAVQGKDNIFDTDLFSSVMNFIKNKAGHYEERAARIVADHLRTATFLIGDGVLPSNKDQGYILRRLVRRAVFKMGTLTLPVEAGSDIIGMYVDMYQSVYTNLHKDQIQTVFREEEQKFVKTLAEGKKELEKSTDPFILWTTYGFPIELTVELRKGVDVADFDTKMKKHQDLSRAGAEHKFKGGLADTSEMSVRYHTATHLLNAALRQVLGPHVMQKGSNITAERMRFDFSHPQKMTDEEKKRVEDIVNQAISDELPVSYEEMPKAEAEKLGAVHAFGEKYGDVVKVYTIGHGVASAAQDVAQGALSREFCGGPHVENTRELAYPATATGSSSAPSTSRFKIVKEEAVSQGVRRIKAVLE